MDIDERSLIIVKNLPDINLGWQFIMELENNLEEVNKNLDIYIFNKENTEEIYPFIENNKSYLDERYPKTTINVLKEEEIEDFEKIIAIHKNIFIMEGNYIHHPKYLPILINGIDNYDMVIASRYIRGGNIEGLKTTDAIKVRIANTLVKAIFLSKVQDITSNFFGAKTSLIHKEIYKYLFSDRDQNYLVIKYNCERQKIKSKEVPVIFSYKSDYKEKYLKNIKLALKLKSRSKKIDNN